MPCLIYKFFLIIHKVMNIGELIKKYRESLSRNEARTLSDLSFKSKEIFSIEDVLEYTESPKDFIYNLSRKNWILRIKKGVYMMAPLEAGELGARSHTVHGFVVASYLVKPYYISHWSALNYYRFTEQTPPAVYVTSTKPRNRKMILDTKFIFVTVPQRKMFGTAEIKVENHAITISTPEKTMVDCLDHPEHCGGISEVSKAIYYEHDSLDLPRIIGMAEIMGNGTIVKRLGYLLDVLGLEEYGDTLEAVPLLKGYSNLDPKLPKKGRINERWKLRVNVEIDPRKWMR